MGGGCTEGTSGVGAVTWMLIFACLTLPRGPWAVVLAGFAGAVIGDQLERNGEKWWG